jgi:hypothetical protein
MGGHGGDYFGGTGGRLLISARSWLAYRCRWAIAFQVPTVPTVFTSSWFLRSIFPAPRSIVAATACKIFAPSRNASGVFSPRITFFLAISRVCLPHLGRSIPTKQTMRTSSATHGAMQKLHSRPQLQRREYTRSSTGRAQIAAHIGDVSICSEQSAQKVHKSPASGIVGMVNGCILAKKR